MIPEAIQRVRDSLVQCVIDDLKTRANRTGFPVAMLGVIVVDAAGISAAVAVNPGVTGIAPNGALEAFNVELEAAITRFVQLCPKIKLPVRTRNEQ